MRYRWKRGRGVSRAGRSSGHAVRARAVAGTLTPDDPTLGALLRRLPPRSPDGLDARALTTWLSSQGVVVPPRGLPLSTLEPSVVPAGTDRAQLVGAKARQMLESAGFDKTLLAAVSDKEAQALWVAHFNQGHDVEAQGSLLSTTLAGGSEAASRLAAAVEQRGIDNAWPTLG